MAEPDVIGEGSYGCVHKPALFCGNKTYASQAADKISKIMTKKHASKEMKEYVLIENADRALNYYLGKPTECNVSDNPINQQSIAKCKNGEKILENIDNYSLLVMEDGGINLTTFANEASKWEKNDINKGKIELFWLEAHRLLRGLKVFLQNNIIHHDLKPQNIVYDVDKNRLNFIDFGLMISRSEMENRLRDSNYWLATYHWSFPLEIEFLNKNMYDRLSAKPIAYKEEYMRNIIDDLTRSPSRNSSKAINTFLSVITNHQNKIEKKQKICNNILLHFSKTVINQTPSTTSAEFSRSPTPNVSFSSGSLQTDIGNDNYEDFMNESINTIDSYGVGIAFTYVLNYTAFLIDEDLANDFYKLFYHMFHPDLSTRFEIDDILAGYEYILEINGVLKKYNKQFVDHKLVDIPIIYESIENKIDAIDVEGIILTPAELDKAAVSPVKSAPPHRLSLPTPTPSTPSTTSAEFIATGSSPTPLLRSSSGSLQTLSSIKEGGQLRVAMNSRGSSRKGGLRSARTKKRNKKTRKLICRRKSCKPIKRG